MKLYCPNCYEINEWGSETCVRCEAALRSPEGETYVQRLIWALRHPESSTALRAATILGKLNAPEAEEPLARALEDPATDPYVGAAAARSLGRIGGERARETLMRALENGPVSVRLAAVEALGVLGPENGTADALRRTAEHDRSPGVREESRKALGTWRNRT